MFKIVAKENPLFLHSSGYYDREKAQARIDSGDVYKYLYEKDKALTFIVVEEA
jgi:hypothetical protein